MPTRRTRQLLLREYEPADVDALSAIQCDAAAMQFTYVARDRDAAAAFLDAHAKRFEEDGYSPWTAVLCAGQRVAGWGGLCRDPDAPHLGTEVIYFIDRAYWGRGLASEIVEASLAFAFDDHSLREVGAFARPANLASIRVLTKAGFERTGFVEEFGRDRFRIDIGRWKSRKTGTVPVSREEERA